MIRTFTLLLFPLFFVQLLNAQVVDRYPYIQSPTETSVIIAWRTASTETGMLLYGDDSADLDTITESASTKKHVIQLNGLSPNTLYHYQVVMNGVATSMEQFYTSKREHERSFNFLHYGDCGYDNSIQNDIAALMEAETVDFAVVAGDVDQGDGDAYDEVFFGVYKDMLAEECHYTALGNHDIIANNGADYLDAFYLPHNNPDSTEQYYSFTWGHSKFVCLDSNIPYTQGTSQYNWLEDELRCNDRQWLFVFFHHPPWTNAWDPSYFLPFQPFFQYDGNDDMRNSIVPLFELYDVDYVLNGHSHCYQRGDLNGVEYVISGGAGSSLIDSKVCNTFPYYNSCAPNINTEIYTNMYVRFDVEGDTATYTAIDRQNNVIDQKTIIKTYIPYLATINVQEISCPGQNDASINLNVVGPKAPYSLIWNTGDTINQISNLSAGSYSVTVTNTNGCYKIHEYEINEADTISLVYTSQDASGLTTNDGWINLDLSPVGSYTFSWSDSSILQNRSNLLPGAYAVTITDSAGCSISESFQIEVDCFVPDSLWSERITARSARLRWIPVPGASGYQILGNRVGSSIIKLIRIPNGALNYKDVYGLANNQSYEWQIRALCMADPDSSDFSPMAQFTTGCFAPSSISSSNATSSSVLVSWSKVLGIEGYEYRYREAGTTNWIVQMVTGSSNNAAPITGLNSNTLYEWRVKTICKSSNFVYSVLTATDTFQTLSERKGFHNTKDEAILQVIPNPFSESAKLIFPNMENAKYQLYLTDISGHLIRNHSLQGSIYHLSKEGLASGLYLLELRGPVNYRRKIVIR